KAPVVRFSLYTGGGNASVAEGQQGLAQLLAEVITKGAANHSAEEIAAEVESIGGTLSAAAAAEHIAISIAGPSFEQERLLGVLADVAMHPTFPAAEFSIAQQQLIADMAFDESDPLTLADRQFRRVILDGHPYSAYSTPAIMETLTPEDLAAFHAAYFVPGNALLVITGDMTELEARRQVEVLFGEWPAGDAPDYLDYPEATPRAQDVIYLIDQPAAGQAVVRVGNRAIRGAAEDRFALLVANHALGGRSQTSRLYRNLRADKGYTYGVRSTLDMLQDAGAFVIAGSVNEETAGAAIHEILFELERLSREGLSDEELANAKSFLTGQYLMQTAVPNSFADILASYFLLGLPWESANEFVGAIEAVTAAEVQAAVNQYIEVEQPAIVVVGDAEVLLPQLEELGEVVLVDAQGEPVE
ncbi:MAG TPA: pitrilysin family protein, partial [Caldilineaceae bacterium]|nr:pitrilysin family protein [Caldilineaceae bacterium]